MEFSEIEFAGRTLRIETGKVATQTNSACWVQYGETIIIATATCTKEPKEGVDYLPFVVDYHEKAYAAGKIPGGFIKREGRPGDKEILNARLIDRPLRPLFPVGFTHDVQIIVKVLSADQINPPDILGVIGASCALTISDIPFNKPIGCVRIGWRNGNFILNPTYKEIEESDLDLVVAGGKNSIVMMEGSGKEVSEDVILDAIALASEHLPTIIDLQFDLQKKAGKEKMTFSKLEVSPELETAVREICQSKIKDANRIPGKKAREAAIENITKDVLDTLSERFPEQEFEIKMAVEKTEREIVRTEILNGKRVDGRAYDEIRPISCEVGILPRAHGSSLFTRGETQSIVATTLGTGEDEQIIDDIEGRTSKRFMVHYYFPPFSVGEVRPMRGPGRREIGHGALAEKAIAPLIPSEEKFPYTIRLVSDILESNGSTSMATVCGGSLSLMEAGVPISSSVAGISIGLVKESEQEVLLSDITGLEDKYGDMDLKIAGTRKGVTGIQLDLKIEGLSHPLIAKAFDLARVGRLSILDKMDEVIAKPRELISKYAPKVRIITIMPEKIRDVIGPGGKTIRGIIEKTGVKIDISDDGKIVMASSDEDSLAQAGEMIEYLTAEAKEGEIYLGKVTAIKSFGAFVEILPGREGLIHISELADYRVHKVEDVLSEGDEVLAKVIGIDDQGRINLSRRQALREKRSISSKRKAFRS
jgi:polyribonucleotide nucleotidyltransferase